MAVSSETKRALVQHATTGDLYIVEYVWDGDHVTGTRIVATVGPVSRRDLGVEGPLEPSAELFDRIDAAVNLTADDAEWFQGEDEAGRLIYPIGAR